MPHTSSCRASDRSAIAWRNCESRDLLTAIRDWVAAGKPYLGICLGYQILFDSSEETPGVAGLGILPGIVRRFQQTPGLKIPHMGWNSAIPRTPDLGNWAGLGEEPYFYFVHSYFPVPDDDSHHRRAKPPTATRPSPPPSNGRNLLACQFHPEKSQDAGLRLIRNFLGH